MIGSSKNNRENYPRKCFWTPEKKTRVKFNPGLSANRPSNNWAQDARENKTNWFPEGPDIKCFVLFLNFHFNSNKRIAGANKTIDSVLIETQI